MEEKFSTPKGKVYKTLNGEAKQNNILIGPDANDIELMDETNQLVIKYNDVFIHETLSMREYYLINSALTAILNLI
jgi:hypothetical protein